MNEDRTDLKQPEACEDKLALMYPGNQLKAQVRPFEETLSAFKVMKDAFFAEA